ncbi:serine hydrolase domain-containing protein [Longimicrobium sp.]|uniref:serine hydrolase domain-containing protein n=1 Tax=Longimicrobium sp. TaxID=2029185 RepID=UPI002E3543A0|nr:serine hydrolase domain-containing protein [Longimicrobium sp.]HEX6039402.1 serine hydrolase domain-containing protein [Longimicrobium sp.]
MPSPIYRAALAAALSLAAAVPAHAQAPRASAPSAQLPAGAAGRLAGDLVGAVNGGDDDALVRWMDGVRSPESYQPRDEMLGILRALRDQGGGVTVGENRRTPRGNVVVELWGRTVDAGVELVVFPDGADSTRLLRLSVQKPLRRGVAFRPFPRERMDDARIAELIDGQLRQLEAADQFSGVVLVARGDDVLLHGTYGHESPVTGTRITTRTRFHLASQGKMFTSVAIAQLVEQGALSLDQTVGELLPGHPWTEQARGITVRQLLSHTGGLGGLFDRPNFPQDRVFATATERLAYFAGEPLLFAPGTQYSYSNEGFETLGAIIESKTGMRYSDYILRNVLRRAGMRTAQPDAPADSVTDRAIPSPYADDDLFGIRPRVTASRGWNAGGAGGGHSSAEDMFRFARALMGGRLVSRPMVDTLTAGRVDEGGDSRYAYGFQTRQVNGRTVFGHGGGGPRGVAICNDIDVFADGSYTVVVMSNYDAPFCAELKKAITDMLAVN